MSAKPFYDMTEAELRDAMKAWVAEVDHAGGWASAYFAAKQCKAIQRIAESKGFSIINPRPVRVGV